MRPHPIPATSLRRLDMLDIYELIGRARILGATATVAVLERELRRRARVVPVADAEVEA